MEDLTPIEDLATKMDKWEWARFISMQREFAELSSKMDMVRKGLNALEAKLITKDE